MADWWQRLKCLVGLQERRFVGYKVYNMLPEGDDFIGLYAWKNPEHALSEAQKILITKYFQSNSRHALIVNLKAVKEYEYIEKSKASA